jgi:hypothetical protein
MSFASLTATLCSWLRAVDGYAGEIGDGDYTLQEIYDLSGGPGPLLTGYSKDD